MHFEVALMGVAIHIPRHTQLGRRQGILRQTRVHGQLRRLRPRRYSRSEPVTAADKHHPSHHRRPSPKYLLAVASHLWGSDVHQAAVNRLELQDGEHVLDLGAGLGPAAICASHQVGDTGRVTAIDPSRMMRIAIRLRKALCRNSRSISVQDGVAEALPLADQSIDAIVALNVVHLLQDRQAAAIELRRVLKSNGRIAFVEEDLEHPQHRFHQPGGHHGPHSSQAAGVDTMTIALNAAGLATSTSSVDRFGGQPAHIISATAGSTRAVI